MSQPSCSGRHGSQTLSGQKPLRSHSLHDPPHQAHGAPKRHDTRRPARQCRNRAGTDRPPRVRAESATYATVQGVSALPIWMPDRDAKPVSTGLGATVCDLASIESAKKYCASSARNLKRWLACSPTGCVQSCLRCCDTRAVFLIGSGNCHPVPTASADPPRQVR